MQTITLAITETEAQLIAAVSEVHRLVGADCMALEQRAANLRAAAEARVASALASISETYDRAIPLSARLERRDDGAIVTWDEESSE